MRMTADEYAKIVWYKKASEVLWNVKKDNKFGAIETDGYDSKLEANRATILWWMQRTWLISELQEQVPFVLQDSFIHDSQTIRSIKYIADFVYIQNWEHIVEDAKWFRTAIFKLKKKMFLKRYWKQYKFIETN